MRKEYQELQVRLVLLTEEVVRTSGEGENNLPWDKN